MTLAALGLASAHSALAAETPSFSKVMVVVFENVDYKEAMKQPDFARLASEGALLANFHAEAHPSQPNYLALVSGATQGVHSDHDADINARHIGDLLDEGGKTWRAYLEGYPGNCFSGGSSGNYVRKHNPFISFENVRKDPGRCSKLVSADELSSDIKAKRLPDFSLYIPDIKNDGHDTGVNAAGQWLSRTFLPSLGPTLPKGLLLVVTFDEDGSGTRDNGIYTVFSGASVKAGSRSEERYDHYSILRTIEKRFALGELGKGDSRASPVEGIWK